MTRQEQSDFVAELMESVRQELLAKVAKVPAVWDGIELRRWIADTFEAQVYGEYLKGQRLKAYHNTLLAENL